ncbi:hypothetical protein ACS0TY_030472 [Phlomoides rotata]
MHGRFQHTWHLKRNSMTSEPLAYDVELTPVQTKIAPPTAPLFPDQRWSNLILIPSPQELDTSEKTLRSCKRTTTNVQQANLWSQLQKPDMKAFTYIREQEMKPELVVSLTEDEISTRRAWGIWVCLTEMDKVKYPFKIYQNSANGSFLLNSMTGSTTRFANNMFDGKTS